MVNFAECLGIVAPYYNLLLVIVVLALFIKLFSIPNKKIFILPWQLLFFSVVVYIIEELLTVFYIADIVKIPRVFNAVFELIIIIVFIYALLRQQEYIKNTSIRFDKKHKDVK